MAKKKRKAKEGIQVGLFEAQEQEKMAKPVDLHETPPAPVVYTTPDIGQAPPRLRILIGSTKSCPHCGELIVTSPAGGIKCSKCWWWQSLAE